MSIAAHPKTLTNSEKVAYPVLRGASTTVAQVFRRHMRVLAGLPGAVSEFRPSDFGNEWRCEFEIGHCSSPAAQAIEALALQLHFSLIDIDRQAVPSAVLYFVELCPSLKEQGRHLLPLDELTETHERLNELLRQREVSIELFDNANRFVVALTQVRESLGSAVSWA